MNQCAGPLDIGLRKLPVSLQRPLCHDERSCFGAEAALAALPIRVLVVDDYEPFRRFLRSTLEGMPDLPIIGEASDGLKAVQKAEEGVRPRAVLSLPRCHPGEWAYNKAHDVGVAPCRQPVPPRQKFIVSASSLHQAAPVSWLVRTAHYQLRSRKAPTSR